jgi:ribosomal protein S18 acetylase RimI-like enzyme
VGYNYNTLSESSPDGHYVRIATHPDYRMIGVATTLTVKAFEYFKKNKVQRILLSTYANNETTNQLYQKWGFRLIGQELFMAKEF